MNNFLPLCTKKKKNHPQLFFFFILHLRQWQQLHSVKSIASKHFQNFFIFSISLKRGIRPKEFSYWLAVTRWTRTINSSDFKRFALFIHRWRERWLLGEELRAPKTTNLFLWFTTSENARINLSPFSDSFQLLFFHFANKHETYFSFLSWEAAGGRRRREKEKGLITLSSSELWKIGRERNCNEWRRKKTFIVITFYVSSYLQLATQFLRWFLL